MALCAKFVHLLQFDSLSKKDKDITSLKGLGHEIKFKYFDKIILLGLNRNLDWFFNFSVVLIAICMRLR